MTTTAELHGASALVHAPGGGQGHLARALALCRRFALRGRVLHQARWEPAAPNGVELQRMPEELSSLRALLLRELPGRVLVADTFPGGLAGELDDEVLRAASSTVLVQRALKLESYPDYEALAARFALRLLPYDQQGSEWEAPPPGCWIGPLVRRLCMEGGPRSTLLLIGQPEALPPGWRAALPADLQVLDGPFDTLPAARRVLTVGAGYNLVHELLSLPVPSAHVPLERRYDDQFRRAGNLGRAVTSRAELLDFLNA